MKDKLTLVVDGTVIRPFLGGYTVSVHRLGDGLVIRETVNSKEELVEFLSDTTYMRYGLRIWYENEDGLKLSNFFIGNDEILSNCKMLKYTQNQRLFEAEHNVLGKIYIIEKVYECNNYKIFFKKVEAEEYFDAVWE